MMKKGQLTFAKSDPALSLASLFRPVTRGRRLKGQVLESAWGDGLTLSFKIHTGLDTTDQSVFLTLVAMAAVKGRDIDKRTDSEIGRQLWLDLHDDDDVGVQYNGRATAFRTSYYEIIKEMGLTLSARSYATLLASLDRLDGVSFKAETSSSIYPSQRLLTYQVDKANRNIAIVLNSRICQALSGHYVRIELAERHQLESDTSKVCHAWLCAWCGTGSSKSIGIDKLLTKIWGSDASSASTTRSRRQILRAGIKQIDKLPGWTIREDDRGIIRIKRDAILDAS